MTPAAQAAGENEPKRRKIAGKQVVAPGWAMQAAADSMVAEGAVAPHMQHELANESAQKKDSPSM